MLLKNASRRLYRLNSEKEKERIVFLVILSIGLYEEMNLRYDDVLWISFAYLRSTTCESDLGAQVFREYFDNFQFVYCTFALDVVSLWRNSSFDWKSTAWGWLLDVCVIKFLIVSARSCCELMLL